ncbi:hypothetical protein [Sulfoacidibacillus thermotolerans]|uniref:Flagellar protein FliT n=1 Tax=Sulfoacidibacillus thermotolerans TaxID=1765684 RepID=A0A2U3D7M2_SULT2|nr:hypothetical protein [Sulfoacidibacillus thermotolerans]PWI57274.1 hypothetical protein BM613_09255 [Sulfoacidibacillus thermotolerans]
MTAQRALELMAILEKITDEVIENLVSHQPQKLESLVIDQCRYLRELQSLQTESLDRERLNHLHQRVCTQQTLIAQAQQVTEFFLQRLNEGAMFQTLG